MNVLRSKFYPADTDGSLSLKGIIVYEDHVRNNLKMHEQYSIEKEANKFMK